MKTYVIAYRADGAHHCVMNDSLTGPAVYQSHQEARAAMDRLINPLYNHQYTIREVTDYVMEIGLKRAEHIGLYDMDRPKLSAWDRWSAQMALKL